METSGSHFDEGKPRVDLLDADALEGIAKVLTFGAQKYATHNWRGGIAYSRIIGSILRHLFAILRGEDTDSESGLPHVDHAGCDLMFLSYFMKKRKDLDDRYKEPHPTPDRERAASNPVHQAHEHATDGVYDPFRTSGWHYADPAFSRSGRVVGKASRDSSPTCTEIGQITRECFK